MKKTSKDFCGECLRQIVNRKHCDDGTAMCKDVPGKVRAGAYLEFQVDTETRDRIEESGLDPRRSEYWERHEAADGNKGWRSWKGEQNVEVSATYRRIEDSRLFWCATCGGYRAWTHECRSSNYRERYRKGVK